MNIGFVMYNWESVEPKLDTTLRLINECLLRGHKVTAIYPNEMAIRRTEVWANTYVISSNNLETENFIEFYRSCTLKEEFVKMCEHDVVFFRDNPPLDNHLLNFMDTLENDVFFINSISRSLSPVGSKKPLKEQVLVSKFIPIRTILLSV